MFTGRPWPATGEALFTTDDTDLAVALALEERDTCPSCGLPMVWCRDGKAYPFTDYEVTEQVCQPTLRLERYRESDGWKTKHAATQAATRLSTRFREGREPDIDAGLGLPGADQDAE